MKEILIGSLVCLFMICAMSMSQQVVLSNPPGFVVDGDRVLLIKGRVAGDLKSWMSIEAHNGQEWKGNGFDPSYTRVLSDYQPLFRKLPNGTWEIMFTSPIAKDLP